MSHQKQIGVACLAALVAQAALAAATSEVCKNAAATPPRGSVGNVLLQTHRAVERSGGVALQSGDRVFLRAPSTGKPVTIMKNGVVHTKWNQTGFWQKILVEKSQEDGPIMSGDAVFLTGWTGKRITVQGHRVHAKWANKGSWERLVMERKAGDGPVMTGDVIFLRAHNGARIDGNSRDHPGQVNSRWSHKGSWQQFVIEIAAPRAQTETSTTTAEPTASVATTMAPGTASPTTAPAPAKSVELVSALALEHFELINRLRAEGFTCPEGEAFDPNPTALKFDCKLWRASRLHSQDMADNSYFGHSSQDGRSPSDRAKEQKALVNGENIAAGSDTAKGAVEQFKKSDEHCKTMLNPASKVAAVGYGTGGRYQYYWTEMFASSEVAGLDMSCYREEMKAEDDVMHAEVQPLSALAAEFGVGGKVAGEPCTTEASSDASDAAHTTVEKIPRDQ